MSKMRLNIATIHALRKLESIWILINAKIIDRLLTLGEGIATGTIPTHKCVVSTTTRAQCVSNCLALRTAKETSRPNSLVAPANLRHIPRNNFAVIISRTQLLPVLASFTSE